jgi:hypothetical protein
MSRHVRNRCDWLMIVEGRIAHVLSKLKLRRMQSALMRDSRDRVCL